MGEAHPRYLLRKLSSRDISEWMAYDQLEPFGEERADMRSGIIASTIANANRDPKRKKRPFTHQDFMPRFWQESKDPTAVWAAIEARFSALETLK